jgi:hypothetical protein
MPCNEGGPDGPPSAHFSDHSLFTHRHPLPILTAVLRRLSTVLLTAAVALAVPAATAPAAASAATSPNHLLLLQQGSAMAGVWSLRTVPLGFTTSAQQAVTIAEHTATMQALHRHLHPLQFTPFVWRSQHPYWYVVFTYRGKIAADVAVSPAGKVTGVWTGLNAIAPYTHGHWAWSISSWMILLPAALLFMLPFVDPRRLRRITLLDGVAVVAFLVSYLLLANSKLQPAVWLAYPPLIYLLVRLLRIGFGRDRPAGRLAPLLRTPVLIGGLALMLVARILLSLLGHQEIDVGYESVIGAYRILHHMPLYWNDPNHGDTYGPITYLAYVPFEVLFPWKNSLSNLHAADLAAIVWDLGTIIGLVLLGRRLRAGSEGTRLGLVLAWAWAACPFTIIGLVVHTNDALVAMLTVFTVLALSSPVVSGALLGLAAAAKFSPAGLLPLIAAPRQRGWKGAAVCVAAFTAIVVTASFSWLPPGGFSYFWQRTIHFQITRVDVFSPWALHPSLHPIQTALELLALVLAAAVAFFPRGQRSPARACALAGAVTLAIQLPATHWYYYYILWFLPFVLVATLAGTARPDAGSLPPLDESVAEPDASQPILARV